MDPALVLALLSFGLVALAFRDDLVPGLRRPDRAPSAGASVGRTGSAESSPEVPGSADAASPQGLGTDDGSSDKPPETAEDARDLAADALQISSALPDRIADSLDGHEKDQAVPEKQGRSDAGDPESPHPGPPDAGVSDRRLAERQMAADRPAPAGAPKRDAPDDPALRSVPADRDAEVSVEQSPPPFHRSQAASAEVQDAPEAARPPAGGNPAGGGTTPDTAGFSGSDGGLTPASRQPPSGITPASDWPAPGARPGHARASGDGEGGGAVARTAGLMAAMPAPSRAEAQAVAGHPPRTQPAPSFARLDTVSATAGAEGSAPADRVRQDQPGRGPHPVRNGPAMAADRTPPGRDDDTAFQPEPPRPDPAGNRGEPGLSLPGNGATQKASGMRTQPMSGATAAVSAESLDQAQDDAPRRCAGDGSADAGRAPGRDMRAVRAEAGGPAPEPTTPQPVAPPLRHDGGAEPGPREGAGIAEPPGKDRIDDPPPLHVSGFRPGIDVLSIRLGPHVTAWAASGTLTLSGHSRGTDLSLRLVGADGQVIYDRRLGTLDGVRPEALNRKDFDLANLPDVTLRSAPG